MVGKAYADAGRSSVSLDFGDLVPWLWYCGVVR